MALTTVFALVFAVAVTTERSNHPITKSRRMADPVTLWALVRLFPQWGRYLVRGQSLGGGVSGVGR